MNDAEFTGFLAQKGLGCLAANTTLDELRQRYGTRQWYGFQEIVELGPVPLFDECKQPFHVLTSEPELLPPDEFQSDFDALQDGPKNHDLALGRLIHLFGTCTPTVYANSLCHQWTFGRMSLRILTFLKERAVGPNPLYAKYPELWNKTRITITRNWVPPISPAEALLLSELPESMRLPVPASASLNEIPFGMTRGFFRLHEAAAARSALWRTHDGSKIGWTTPRASCFFDSKWIRGLRLERYQPARGSGCSNIAMELLYPFQRIPAPTSMQAISMPKPHDCDGFVNELAAFWGGLPVSLSEWDDD